MNIENLSDEQKSVMLARLRGWSVINVKRDSGAWCRVLCDENKTEILPTILFGGGVEPKHVELKPSKRFNLYNSANTALACKVLNLSCPLVINYEEFSTCAVNLVAYGQRGALDYVLLRAIEAGMIEVSE